MSERQGSLIDAAENAVKMERLEGQQALLAQRVSHGMEAVASTLANVQVEVRALTVKLSELAGLQQSHDQNRDSIDDIKTSIAGLNARLESLFREQEQRNERRWEQHEANREAWRREHEAENENTKRDTERDMRVIREKISKFAGFATAVGLVAGVVTGGFIWNINYRFNEAKEDAAKLEARAIRNADRIERNSDSINDLKLYLARGGRIPPEPYVTPDQRTDNGNAPAARQP